MGAIVSTAIAFIFNVIPGDLSEWSYCFKWIICYIYIQINRKLTKKRFDYYDAYAKNDPVKVNFIPAPEEKVIETPLEEADLSTRADEVFCYGVNSKSDCLIVRVARCLNNEAEAWIYLKLSNGKVYQLKETSGYEQSCCEKKVFSCGGLQMHYISPMRRWRIFYNGSLQEIDENDGSSGKLVHVKFSFIWCASSDVFDFKTDIDASSLARSVAKAKWIGFTPPLKKLENLTDGYAQCGIITGTVNIENSEDDYIIYLFGERVRFTGDAAFNKRAEFSYLLGQMTKTGSYVHITEVTIEHVAEKLSFGFFVQQSGEMSHIRDVEVSIEKFVNENEISSQVKGQFTMRNELNIIKGVQVLQPTLFKTNKSWNGFVSIGCSDFRINSLECKGLLMKGKIIETVRRETKTSKISSKPKDQPFVVHFHEKPCQDSNFTGGKGSSLGILTELSKELKTFIVPKGIVVTTVSYELFLTSDILKEINHLEKVLYGSTTGDVKDSCHRVMQAIINAEMPSRISQAVNGYLGTAFPNKDNMKFAVRSSATGEDTEQMSAAGQMETYLGVMGADEIILSIKKCWASQFSYIAVQYKRQNGQVINSPMAVVIQEMIPCDVAGVLFTCDPLTGNPNLMSITANYGLGESVVSASEEPDTVELKRDGEENVIIQSKHIGSKKGRIILSVESGTDTVDVSEEERNTCCLSDELIILLGKLALKIEKHYRSRRDIEWGFWNKKLFIFQSRPVTSGSEETVYEIEHEFDAPLRMENDYFTVCNVGEVMPGAFSPLGLEIVLKYFQIAFKAERRGNWFDEKPKYFSRGIVSMYSHAMFYCCDLLARMDESKDMNDATLVSLFGRVIEDNEMFDAARERFKMNKKSGFANFYNNCVMMSRLFTAKACLKEGLRHYENYRIPIENYKTAQNLYDALLGNCTDLIKAINTHLRNTESSSIWNVFVFNILKNARGEINSEVYRDFAKLLMTDTDVESADVPSALASLAHSIEKELNPEDFKKKEIKDILEWLENSKTDASLKYREFLKKHGHRCLKEFDIHSKTWDTDSETLIKLLKNLVGSTSKSESKTEKDVNKIISDLGINFGFKSKLILKFLIPKSRQGVQLREASKSLLIKATNEWRKAYCHLAKLMVLEGRLPDEDLLFYMTLEEIGELLETRSPKIIARSNHRRRHYPTMEKYIFPEIMKGFPKPVNLEQTTIVSNDENFSMKGIPVSQGIAKAYVRVALSLEEAAELKAGEILLTYSTDIGWSPYFPILAGVVTELGGLISHGAVVSREYGLPCIAGLHGATRQFQTGDYVLLDGNKGILQRLPKPEIETKL